ncbi:hypothetical protein [Methanobacterium oryzae]|uniref:hypothetical protein n=1 Tax=Methanobacterium oryzae TaxID=69540 RepID=UPI003D2073A0
MSNQAIIELALNELADEFQNNPDEFFNEHDFHHKFFCMLYPKFKNLIHPEYPTRKRFIKERAENEKYIFGKHCFDPDTKKGVRGHYDFVIFKEEFYNEHKDALDKFDRLSNKKVDTNIDIEDMYIDFAFEFKYITSGSINVIKEVEFDIFKLNEAAEAENKYLIIFIKKIFSDKGFRQIIEPLNKLKKEQKVIEMLIFSR